MDRSFRDKPGYVMKPGANGHNRWHRDDSTPTLRMEQIGSFDELDDIGEFYIHGDVYGEENINAQSAFLDASDGTIECGPIECVGLTINTDDGVDSYVGNISSSGDVVVDSSQINGVSVMGDSTINFSEVHSVDSQCDLTINNSLVREVTMRAPGMFSVNHATIDTVYAKPGSMIQVEGGVMSNVELTSICTITTDMDGKKGEVLNTKVTGGGALNVQGGYLNDCDVDMGIASTMVVDRVRMSGVDIDVEPGQHIGFGVPDATSHMDISQGPVVMVPGQNPSFPGMITSNGSTGFMYHNIILDGGEPHIRVTPILWSGDGTFHGKLFDQDIIEHLNSIEDFTPCNDHAYTRLDAFCKQKGIPPEMYPHRFDPDDLLT